MKQHVAENLPLVDEVPHPLIQLQLPVIKVPDPAACYATAPGTPAQLPLPHLHTLTQRPYSKKSGRGRNAGYPAPPAQIRTWSLNHPAPTFGG